MMKTLAQLSLLWLTLFFGQSVAAQNQIAGTIRNTANEPLPSATILLLSAADSSLVRGAIAGETGAYLLENVPNGAFLCAFSMLGFEKTFSRKIDLNETNTRVDLGPVILKENTTMLSEVGVVGKRPFLEQKIDRMVVNVANSVVNAGGTALQVLQRSPGVQVNLVTKSISLAGKQGVIVMINGKESRLPADAVTDMLAGMNADNIDRIELIHTPPANFEAAGNAGIINIVLKSTDDDGFNGGYSAKAGYGSGPKYGGGLYFNYRRKRVNVFGNYDLDFNLNPQVFTNYRSVRQGADVFETDTYSDRPHTPTTTQNARLGLDFQISPKTVVGVLGSFFDRDWYMEAENRTRYLKNGTVDSLLRMPNTETNHARSFAGNLNLIHQFSAGHSLSVDADLIQYDINNPSHYEVENRNASGAVTSQNELRIDKKTPIRVAVAKADYNLGLGKTGVLEAGIKYTALRFDNDVRVENRLPGSGWSTIAYLTSRFKLDETVAGAYATFSTKFGSKTDLKAGLRYEFTRSNLGSEEMPNVVDRRYGSWFPTVFLTHHFSDVQSLNFSYSRRIMRPQIHNLAPWLIFSDPTTTEGGNPALQPSFTDAFRLAYSFKTWNLDLSYSIEHDPMAYVPTIDQTANRQSNSMENLDQTQVVNANLSFSAYPAKWWELRPSLFGGLSETRFQLEGRDLQVRYAGWGINVVNTLSLPRSFTLEISGDYYSPSYWGITYWTGAGVVNIALEKNLGERWGKLRLAAGDVFRSFNWFGTTDQPEAGVFVKSSFQTTERTFILSWTNTFGNRKLKSQRQRQTGAAEALQRI